MKIVLINNPTQKDYLEVIKLLNEVFSRFPGYEKYTAEVAHKRMKDVNDSKVMKVVDEKGDLMAFAICYERYKGYYHIWQLGVGKNNRNEGIASKMYGDIENYAKKRKYKGVTLNSFSRYKANIYLIKKRGYKLFKKDSSGNYSGNPKLMFKMNFG